MTTQWLDHAHMHACMRFSNREVDVREQAGQEALRLELRNGISASETEARPIVKAHGTGLREVLFTILLAGLGTAGFVNTKYGYLDFAFKGASGMKGNRSRAPLAAHRLLALASVRASLRMIRSRVLSKGSGCWITSVYLRRVEGWGGGAYLYRIWLQQRLRCWSGASDRGQSGSAQDLRWSLFGIEEVGGAVCTTSPADCFRMGLPV